MKYQALYRKYRPKNFDEVSGQKINLTILKNAISKNKVAHAYLFYGPRGTGKTSIAKIFARTINCEKNQEGILCEKCNSCIVSKEKECVDIIEIDAASNNGVDEIRELRNKVSFVPSELKYKVYIIDEVHMLSIGAFNALLKTLEEPPEHVIFILATTELHKVPVTIISRCQTLEFKKINDKDMKNRLKEIADCEKIEIDEDAFLEIIRYSNGGLRDAVGILEKAIAYSENKIDSNTIKEISGNVTQKELEEFIENYENKNIEFIIKKINEYYDNGIDLIKLTNELIEYIRNKIVLEKKYNKYECSIVKQFDELIDFMKKSENPKILFEITMLNILTDDKKENIATISEYNIEKNDKIKNKSLEDSISQKNTSLLELKKVRVSNTLYNPQKNIINYIRNNWEKIKNLAFDVNYGNIARLLSSDILPVAASDSNVILISKLNGIAEQINADIYMVEKIFEITFEKKYKIICISENEWNEYIELYKKDKTYFKYEEEKEITTKKEMSLKEKAKDLFGDI